MKNTKIKNNIIAFLILSFVFLPIFIFADNPLIETEEDVIEILRRIGVFLFRVFVFATVIAFLIAGFYYLTAGGNPNNLQKSHNMIKFGLIGVVVALLAGSVVAVVESLLETS